MPPLRGTLRGPSQALAFALFATLALNAQSPQFTWTREEVAKGVFLLRGTADGPLSAAAVEVDLALEGITLATRTAHDGVPGRERVSGIAERARASGVHVLAAINADFFGPGGLPLGLTAVDGDLVVSSNERSVFTWSPRYGPAILRPSLELALRSEATRSEIPIGGVNRREPERDPVLYTQAWRGAIPAQDGAHAWPLLLATTAPRLDRGLRVQWASAPMPDLVPSPHRLFLRSRDPAVFERLVEHQDWRLTVRASPEVSAAHAVVAGAVRLLDNGQPDLSPEGTGESFRTARHPRSAVGISKDKQRLWLVVVDGRAPGHSIGLGLADLAQMMLGLGAADALNLDGGGSSALWAQGRIVQRPSDSAGERPVGNALLVLGTHR